MATFDFRFDSRFRPALAAFGVRPATTSVTVRDGLLRVRYGPWSVHCEVDNVVGTEISGPFRWYRAVGPRLSLSDRGVTFGTNADEGLCLRLRRPVKALDPFGVLRHPGLTVTVSDVAGLQATLS